MARDEQRVTYDGVVNCSGCGRQPTVVRSVCAGDGGRAARFPRPFRTAATTGASTSAGKLP